MTIGIRKEKINFILLFITMTMICLIVAGAAISILYKTAMKEERLRLKENAESQAYLMEAIARFDALYSTHDHPGGATGASISQIIDAHEKYNGFGESGEFLIGKLENDQIHFLFSHQRRHQGPLPPVPMKSTLAEPMRRALLGKSGTMIGPDYNNTQVLAAYHPVPQLHLGIVAKMDMSEIRAPFIRASITVTLTAFVAITLGALFFFKISGSIISQIQHQNNSLREYADQIESANLDLIESNREIKREISLRRQTTEALQKSEEHTRMLLNSTSEGIYGLDTNGNCTFINAAALSLLGYDNDSDVLNKNMHNLIHHTSPDGSNIPECDCTIFRAFKSGDKFHNDEDIFWRADGTNFAVEYWSYPIKNNDVTIGAVITFFDITEKKKAQQKLTASLSEKETLLKEVHHRVKNNMQIISSLLSLQSRQAHNPETQQVVEECRGRVKTMALIHEKLYRSHNLGSIDFADYLKDLTNDLSRTRQNENTKMNVNITTDQIFLPIDTAIPCGLIINELVTNALKHAFPNKNPGEVTVDFHKLSDGKLSLSIKDNGRGRPPDLDINKTETLGLTLITNLAKQLNATLEYHNDNGFECTFTFTVDDPEAHNG